MKFLHIAFIYAFANLALPLSANACGDLWNNLATPQGSEVFTKNDCCKKGQCANEDEGCKGNCGDNSCHCPTSSTALIAQEIYPFKNFVTELTKANFQSTEIWRSSDFIFIWTPPKIV